MNAIYQFVLEHQLALFMAFSAIVSMLPAPLATERWYGFLYNVLHGAAFNLAKIFPSLRIERKDNGAL